MFELRHQWTGLLVEANPYSYRQLLEKKRKYVQKKTDLSKREKSQRLLFQGVLSKCVSLHPEVSDECEV